MSTSGTLVAITLAERPELAAEISRLHAVGWPAFMREDPVADRLWGFLEMAFAAYQFVLADATGAVIACGNSVPFVWDGAVEGLPAGWDDVLERGVADYQAGRTPNTLSALAAVIDPAHRGGGISAEVIRTMRRTASAQGLRALVAPVRPSLKSRYPLTPMEQYVSWTNTDGLPFDPWLRVHARLGARILAVALASMTISGMVSDWERWARMALPASGAYVVPEALVPIQVDRDADRAVYVEPNVWMLHEVG
jgi:GNAT superfamily N-acetyltransferase